MFELYRRIWHATGRAQIVLIILSIAVAMLAAAPLQYQKDIINGLSGDISVDDLLLLGAQFLGVLILSGGLKFIMGYRSSILSEGVIRRLRTVVYQGDLQRQEPSDDPPLARGTLASMITAESEEVGKFTGAAFSTPLMQIGTLLSVIAFIAASQPELGFFAAAVVIPQAIIVVVLQKHINRNIKERVKLLRQATSAIVATDIKVAEQDILADFDRIYETRRKIFIFKLSSKFALNIINGLGTVGILMLGGWLVLEGETDIGTVVAALTGLGRIAQPWRELIAFYRELSGVRVKFELMVNALPK